MLIYYKANTVFAGCFTHRNYISDSYIKLLLQIIRSIFDNCDEWKKKNIQISQLLESVIQFQSNSSLSRIQQDETFNLLCSVLNRPSLNR